MKQQNQCPLCNDGTLLLDFIDINENYYKCTKCNKIFTSKIVFVFVADNYGQLENK